METPWFKKWAKQASDAIENARVTIEDNVTKNQPHVESMLRHLGDNVASAAQNIQRNLAGDPTTRGPLTEAEIDSLDMVYLTPRIIASAYPVNRSLGAPRQPVAQGNPIELMAALLHQSHQGRYMVWNISEESYDYAYFQDQVLEFRFPGHPAPPLGMLFNICTSIENWLEADPANVAVVHCLTGRGRTATVLACLLAWLGAAAAAPGEALACVSAAKGVPVERLTIPSQRRYVQYFANVLDGVRPRSEPLLLRRVIMNTIPRFGEHGGAEGCCPYIQIFKAGRLVFTATYTPPAARRDSPPRRRRQSSDEGGGGGDAAPQQQQQRPETAAAAGGGGGGVGPGGAAAAQAPTQWAYASDESVAFGVDCVLQGDLLLRGRHLGARGERVSMFRAAFHTGYVPCGVLRLGRAQLDGACDDARFDQDFFLDLIFAPVERPSCGEAAAAAATAAAPSKPSPRSAAAAAPFTDDGGAAAVAAVAAAAREAGLVVNPEATEAYDSMLHRDAQFWEDIEARKARHAERRAGGGGGGGEHVPSAYSQPLERPPATAADLRNRFSITVDDGDDDTAAQRRSARGSLASPSKRLAAAAAAAAAGRKGSSSNGGGGGISDADLLAQLAEAEGDDAFGGSSGGGSSHGALLQSVGGLVDALPPVPPPPPSAAAAAAEQPDAAAGTAAAAPADAADDKAAANAAAPPAQPSATAAAADGGSAPAAAPASHEPAAALAAPAAAFELSALDELEKELGIASLGAGGPAEAPAAAAAAMAAEEEFDLGGDDFDGFESYLESLAGGGGGGKAEGT